MSIHITNHDASTIIEHLYDHLDQHDHDEQLRDVLIRLEIQLNNK